MPENGTEAGGVDREGLDALKRVVEEIGPSGLQTLGALLEAGVPPGEAERILNNNVFVDGFKRDDGLQAFHDSLEGQNPPEFHHLVLFLVELGHTITQAVTEIRNHMPFVLRLMAHNNYRRTFQAVRQWLDVDRKTPEELKRKGDHYRRNGPEGELAALIRKRIQTRETAEAKKAMDERDAKIREKRDDG